ncbi:hypothetical protein [Ruminiclostridium josui]|uniref:hypothetical protein n=1 Tax=Ruminiclostridium josui TaxID=1499 RepID=UPI0006CFA4A4|nr:hypothetical protein [Ruminiclostridium josui]
MKPTLQLKSGDKINDEGRLEKEADVMGSKAAKESSSMNGTVQFKESFNVKQENKVIQRNSKKENNQTDDILDGIQTVIDVIGFVPGVGDIADGVNVGISIVRKDWLGAVLSGIALIPVVGSAMAVPMKTISKVGSKIGDISKTVKNAIKQLVKLLGGAKNVTSKLNRYLDNLKGLLRKLPNLMEKVANSRAVKWLAGKKIVKSILAFAKKIQSGVETVCRKADEVFSNVKKAITKGTNNAIKGGLDVFGNLSKAAEYGLDSYSALHKKLKGTGLEAHHIIEKRLAKALGISSTNSMLSVAVNKTEHQVFTNAWRAIIPYGTDYSKLSKDQIWQAAQKVYKNFPALLEAAKKTIFK